MTEVTGTIYKCQHCEFTGTHKNVVKIHEEKCLDNQLKQAKNTDKQEIYNILDIDVINIKIREFLEKYNMLITHYPTYCSIEIDNNCRPSFTINNKFTGGVFDRSKFEIQKKLVNEYHEIRKFLDDSTTDIDKQMKIFENKLDKLVEHKKSLVLDLSKKYLSNKNER